MIPKLHIMSHDAVKSAYTRIDDTFTSKNGKYVFTLFFEDDTMGTGSYINELVDGDEVLVKLSNSVPVWFINEKNNVPDSDVPTEIEFTFAYDSEIELELGSDYPINFIYRNANGDVLSTIETEVIIADPSIVSYEFDSGEGETVTLFGEALGTTTVTIRAKDYPSVNRVFTFEVIPE